MLLAPMPDYQENIGVLCRFSQ